MKVKRDKQLVSLSVDKYFTVENYTKNQPNATFKATISKVTNQVNNRHTTARLATCSS